MTDDFYLYKSTAKSHFKPSELILPGGVCGCEQGRGGEWTHPFKGAHFGAEFIQRSLIRFTEARPMGYIDTCCMHLTPGVVHYFLNGYVCV